MNIITDTNIWYDIANGDLKVADIKQNNQNLIYATPINILEIVSNVSDYQIERRQRAMIALIQNADVILQDTETHLTHLWGYNQNSDLISWRDILIAVEHANSLYELRNGVLDYSERVTRRVGVDFAHFWRTSHWADFRVAIENVLDQHISGYADARQNGRIIHFDQEHGQEFRNMLYRDVTLHEILNATYDRANLVLRDFGTSLPAELRDTATLNPIRQNAYNSLSTYITAYAEYLYTCATTYAPRDNDWGDLEHFIYLQNDNRLLTNDIRWINIARGSGNENWLFHI